MTTKETDNTLRQSVALALRGTTRSKWAGPGSKLLRLLNKANSAQFVGFDKTYRPVSEDGQRLEPKSTQVKRTAEQVLRSFAGLAGEVWDNEATVDYGNATICADVVVDGVVVISNAPVPLLLHLSKEVEHILAFLREGVTLDTAYKWDWDNEQELYRAATVSTERADTVKSTQIIVPPQAMGDHLYTGEFRDMQESRLVGYWDTTNLSGQLSAARLKAMIIWGEKFLNALRTAENEANSLKVERQNIGTRIFELWFAQSDGTEFKVTV